MVDWFRVLADIARTGGSVRKVAKSLGISRSTIGRYYRGDNIPDFDTGEMLIHIWCETTGLAPDLVPRKKL